MNSFLLEVADPAMARGWRYQIGEEVEVEEDCLASGDDQAIENAWVSQS